MKHPFWIANLGLLLLVASAFAFIYFSAIKIPHRASIEPEQVAPRKELKVAINIKKIYENDLFGTYVKELPSIKSLDMVMPFPTPPLQEKITAPKMIEPEFLDPLQITLKGIIVVGSNDSKNRAIIQEDKTKQESTYKVGDVIQDAQLIRIFKNKIILLRLNGQQEILYLREQDAKLDPSYMLTGEWNSVVKKIDENNYLISPQAFTDRVKNLAQFIDLISATTAYKKGQSVGLRIGEIAPQSLGSLLGLKKGDIITEINNTPTQTTEERLSIYKKIIQLKPENTITINIKRRNNDLVVMYTLEDFDTLEEKKEPAPIEKKPTAFLTSKETDVIKQQQYAFAPTINKMKKADHHIMVQNGKSSMQIGS
jgi:type II secretion system protein C